MQFSVNTEYAPEYIREAAAKYAEMWQLDGSTASEEAHQAQEMGKMILL